MVVDGSQVRRKWPWLDEKYEDAWPLQSYIPTRIRSPNRPKEKVKYDDNFHLKDSGEQFVENEFEEDELMNDDEDEPEDQRARQSVEPLLETDAAVDPASNNPASAGLITLTAGSSQVQPDVVKRIFIAAKGTAGIKVSVRNHEYSLASKLMTFSG